jgi:hypothetical protein
LKDHFAGLLPKGDTLPSGSGSRCPVATLLWCKPWQSKRLLSIHFVQSRNCDNLLSSLFILLQWESEALSTGTKDLQQHPGEA